MLSPVWSVDYQVKSINHRLFIATIDFELITLRFVWCVTYNAVVCILFTDRLALSNASFSDELINFQ